jgi:WD40 repeat protein
VFVWDTGNSVGELNGHGKRVTSCACRPFRLITGSEDTRTVFYVGPPFVLDHSNNDQHGNFVNAVRYSPDGQHIVSVGSDKKVRRNNGAV